MEDPKEVQLPFYARLALTLLAVLLILVLMSEGRSIIIPLFFSLLIAFMLLPLTKWLERHRFPKTLAAIVSILLFVSFLTGIFYILGQQISDFTQDVPKLVGRSQTWISDVQHWVAGHYRVNASRQIEYLNKATSGILSSFSTLAQAALLAVSGFAIWTIFVFIFAFFMLTHRALLRRFIVYLFERRDQQQVQEVMVETRLLANSYVIGLLIEMVIVAILNVGAFLIFGVKYAFLLGILAAVLNIIPYLGIYTATAIAAVVTLSNSSPNHALIVVIILLVVHFIDANMIMPRIVGSRVKMNPLITIVAVLVGHLLWGIPGMFLFIPLVGILKIIFERVEGLKPWALLMGTETDGKTEAPKK